MSDPSFDEYNDDVEECTKFLFEDVIPRFVAKVSDQGALSKGVTNEGFVHQLHRVGMC